MSWEVLFKRLHILLQYATHLNSNPKIRWRYLLNTKILPRPHQQNHDNFFLVCVLMGCEIDQTKAYIDVGFCGVKLKFSLCIFRFSESFAAGLLYA